MFASFKMAEVVMSGWRYEGGGRRGRGAVEVGQRQEAETTVASVRQQISPRTD